MQETLLRMTQCRSVLSVSPLNDMIHDRTMNAVNAGCVPIVEDNLAHRSILHHGQFKGGNSVVWTLHDLRRTASTQWAEIGIPQHINDRLLNHVTGGNQSRVARI